MRRILIMLLFAIIVLSACDTTDTESNEPAEAPDTPVEQPDEPLETPPMPPTFCGDGEVQQPNDNGIDEVCDNARSNGVECNAPYGGSCTYCTDECETERIEGGYCGNGVCEDYETNAICAADCERVFEAPEEDDLLYYLGDIELDGEGVSVDVRPDIVDTFTIAMWLYRNEQDTAYLLSRSGEGPKPRGGYSLSVDRAGFLKYETHSLSEVKSELNDVPVQEWTHVAVVYNRTSVPQLRFVINGEQGRVQNGITPPRPLDVGLLIGRRGPEPRFGFNGTIRDLRIYDRTLSADDIAALSDAQP